MVISDNLDPYNTKRNIGLYLDRIKKNAKLTKKNKELIVRFYEEQGIDRNLTKQRQYKYLIMLTKIAEFYGKDLDKATEQELRVFVRNLRQGNFHNGKQLSDWTLHDYQTQLKHFFRWLHKKPKGQYPECIAWLESNINKHSLQEKAKRKLKESFL